MIIADITEMTIEMFERIAEARADEDAIEYMVGVKLVDGKNCCFHTVKYLDCDIATGDMLGMVEYDGNIKVESIPREMVLFRV